MSLNLSMNSAMDGGPIEEGFKKLLASDSKPENMPPGYVLDQELLQSLWYTIAGVQKESELEAKLLPFFVTSELEDPEMTTKLLETLEYFYSKHGYVPLLNALNNLTIVEFLKKNALSSNKSLREKALLCIYVVSSKLKDTNEVNAIIELKKDLVINHDIIYSKPVESAYFRDLQDNRPVSPSKRSLTGKTVESSRFGELFKENRKSDSPSLGSGRNILDDQSQTEDYFPEVYQALDHFSFEMNSAKRTSVPLDSHSASTTESTQGLDIQNRRRASSHKTPSTQIPIRFQYQSPTVEEPYFIDQNHFQNYFSDSKNNGNMVHQQQDLRITTTRSQGNEFVSSFFQGQNFQKYPPGMSPTGMNQQFYNETKSSPYFESQPLSFEPSRPNNRLSLQSTTNNTSNPNIWQYNNQPPLLNQQGVAMLSGSKSNPGSTRISTTNNTNDPTNQSQRLSVEPQNSIVLGPQDIERISQKQDPSIGNLTVKELLEVKRNPCDVKDCRFKGKITSMEQFLTKNDVLICFNYHNNSDQRRYPLHKHNLAKSFYKHDKFCGECFVDPKIHKGRCYFSRNWFEVFYHPKNYKLLKCNNPDCERKPQRKKYCPLYHTLKEREDWDRLLAEEFQYDRKDLEFDVEVIGEVKQPKNRNSFPYPDSNSPGAHQQNLSPSHSRPFQSLQPGSPTRVTSIGNSPLKLTGSPQSWGGDNYKYQYYQSSPMNQRMFNINENLSNANAMMQIDYNQQQPSESYDNSGSLNSYYDGSHLAQQFDGLLREKGMRLSGFGIENNRNSKERHSFEHFNRIQTNSADLKQESPGKTSSESFIKNTKLDLDFQEEDENDFLELRKYKGPTFQDSEWEEMIKIAGSFLNADGGKLIIGVDEEGVIKGIQMAKKQFETFKSRFETELLQNISPKVEESLYRIRKFPVLNHENENVQKNLWECIIIEITIRKGDKIFFVQKEEYQVCYKWLNGSPKILKGDQINELMNERNTLMKLTQ